jgi:DNA-binding MarR family transcriptional regulator
MITPNSELVLNYLKKNFGREFTKNEIAETLGISVPAVTGSINGLVKKGYVTERMEEVEVEPATDTRKAKVKTIRHETLTEAGLSYDPVAEEEAKQAAKAAEKERKAAERAAAKAAKENA